MYEWLIIGAIITLVLASLVHSVVGERLLFVPMFKDRGNRVLESALGRFVMRFFWHALSVMWMVIAVILYALAYQPENLTLITLYTLGVSFLLIGLLDLVMSKGKHIGWPLLTAIGVFCLSAGVISS